MSGPFVPFSVARGKWVRASCARWPMESRKASPTSVISLSPLRKRVALAALGGIGLACSFETLNWAGLAWISPAVWLLCGMGQNERERLLIGFCGGLGFYLPALHWLRHIPYPVTPYLGWLALAAYLSLYPAVWLWLCWRLYPGRIPRDGSGGDVKSAVGAYFAVSWPVRAGWLIACAMAWVGLEMLMARLLTGFPFLLLGVSQQKVTPVIQIASVAGVCGVSFLAAWFAAGFASSCLLLIQRPARHWVWAQEIGAPGLAVAGAILFGVARIGAPSGEVRPARLALIQPSIPQTVKWDAEANKKAFQIILDLSEEAMAEQPDMVVWPEAALPGLLRFDEETHEAVTGFAVQHKVWLLIGADDAEPARDPDGDQRPDYFNSAFAVSPEGRLAAKYDKRRLVMFGEYIPLAKWLPLLKMLSPVGDGFTPGEKPVWLTPRAPRDLRVGVLICFEDIFSDLAREHADADTDFLLNVTNDGWFGSGSQQWQHAANAAFRAVENGVPIVRCANNGITCWADTRGILHETRFADGRDEHAAGYKIAEIPLPRSREPGTRTFYNRHGDWFGWGCLAATLALLALRMRRRSQAE